MHLADKAKDQHGGMKTRFFSCMLAAGATVLIEGCAIYPAYGPVVAQPGSVTVTPAPVYATPAPVYYGGPLFYPSIGIFGRFGGWHHHYR